MSLDDSLFIHLLRRDGVSCMKIEVTILLSVVSVCFTALFGFAIYMRNKKSDTKQDTAEMTTVIIGLESIKDLVKEIKVDMSNMKDDIRSEMEHRIRLEESLKSAWKRIEVLEGKKG